MIIAIIQARYSATRLPGKVLLSLDRKTVLENVVDRTRKAQGLDKVVVATSTAPEDDSIAKLCAEKDIDCFRGNLNDVLDRYYQAAKKFNADIIVRITADCPLIDPQIIDRAVSKFLSGKFDYVSTGRIKSTFPDGLDTEVFSFEVLSKAWKEAKLPSEREHVTPYIWKNPDKFKIFTLENDRDLSDYRLTLDEEEDYKLLQDIHTNVSDLTTKNIIAYLDSHKKIGKINAKIKRNEGYAQSLKEDREVVQSER